MLSKRVGVWLVSYLILLGGGRSLTTFNNFPNNVLSHSQFQVTVCKYSFLRTSPKYDVSYLTGRHNSVLDRKVKATKRDLDQTSCEIAQEIERHDQRVNDSMVSNF